MSKINYQYTVRDVNPQPSKELGKGNGRLRKYSIVTLGILNLLSALCYLFPEVFTTAELRGAYNPITIKFLIDISVLGTVTFAIFLLIQKQYILQACVGASLSAIAHLLLWLDPSTSSQIPSWFSMGVDWLILSFIVSLAVFATLEKFYPKYQHQLLIRDEWDTDMIYFSINHLLITAIIFSGNYVAHICDFAVSTSIQAWVQSLPIIVQFGLVLIIADFILYWEHRLFHEVPFLWKFHAVHHSVEEMDWLAGSRSHLVSTFVERTLVVVPLYLLGPDKSALDMYVALAAFQAVYIHCNTRLNLGPLGKIFVTPKYHHWHHSSEEPALDTNYSAHTQLFDRLFGTLHNPKASWPAKYGTTEPLPKGYFKQLVYPFS